MSRDTGVLVTHQNHIKYCVRHTKGDAQLAVAPNRPHRFEVQADERESGQPWDVKSSNQVTRNARGGGFALEVAERPLDGVRRSLFGSKESMCGVDSATHGLRVRWS